MTKTTNKTKYEDVWDLMDPDNILEVSNNAVFLRFLESDSLTGLHIGESNGIFITLLALGKENRMLIFRTSIIKLGVMDKERILEVLSSTENKIETAQRHGIKRMLDAFLGFSQQSD